MSEPYRPTTDPADWPRLDDSPAASAQMIAWYAPKTAALLAAKAWDDGYGLGQAVTLASIRGAVRIVHPNPYREEP